MRNNDCLGTEWLSVYRPLTFMDCVADQEPSFKVTA